MKKNVLGLITARGGSKGIPNKNIKKLEGVPLIAYTIKSAQKSKLITDLIVSTDSEKIAKVARKYGADTPFLRPARLAQDKTKHLPVVQHAVKFMEKKLDKTYDYVVVLQPTSPFRAKNDIDNTLKELINTKADSAVSVVKWSETHPIKAKILDGNRVLPYSIKEPEGTRRQNLSIVYKRSGAVYCMTRDLLMKKNRYYGNHIVGYIVGEERSIDIDKIEDWKIAEQILKDIKYEL